MLSRALDIFALLSAVLAAWLWYRASSSVVRRIEHDEELDHRDINRIVTTINRTQILNRRAALATAASALAVALKMAESLVTGR